MSKDKLQKIKSQIKDLDYNRREAYELSQNPNTRSKQVLSMIERMDCGVEASRLESLILND